MSRRMVPIGIVLVLMCLLAPALAAAQGATAELNGRVTDSSGAVLPGVTVTAIQTATGLERATVTDAAGAYLFTSLPPGPYRLEVALQGFRTYVQTGLQLTVGATPTVNAALELGSLEETVTVEAAAPLVDVRSAGISSVVENEEILELPLQGRQVTDLLVLAGAAVQTATATSRSAPGGVRISVGGGFETGVAYVLDGADHNNQQENINYALPFPDALQEFRVATSGLTAQNGVKSGASVNAVTKSGTNRFSGNAFEFTRHYRFNATNPFAEIGPDGKRMDDGLKRNQFGGTLGGPIVPDKLFFFAGYQGTATRQRPSASIARVPTAQMLAGDFTTFASAQCQGGRQVNLRAPFVNNRLNPSLLSPAALNLSARLPKTTDPCGEITYGSADNSDEHQTLGRVDYQLTPNVSFFGRYFNQTFLKDPGFAGGNDNILKTDAFGSDAVLHGVNLGATTIFGASTVNGVRFALNTSKVDNYQNQFFCPVDIGVRDYTCYEPGFMSLAVTGGFSLYPGNQTEALFFNDSYNISDDLTLVRGNHQFGFGGNVRYWAGDYTSSSRTNGAWRITGSNTGLGLADFLAGRITTVEQGNLNRVIVNNTYIGAYVQDSWRASNRVTLNYGMRWEPFLGQNLENGAISIFVKENFDRGIVSQRFPLAPPGFLWPGDPGFPPRQTGMNIQWWNLSPRAGVAWDVHGDGRLAVRSSYSMAYDFMAGEFHNINSGAPPFGNRSTQTNPTGGLDNPYSDVGGNPHPLVSGGRDTEFVRAGGFGSMDPDINSPRVQSWNVTVEQQLGTDWGVAASYIGSYSDRIWGQVALNPGVYLGTDPCVINGVSYRVCSTDTNLEQRRVLTLQNPEFGQFIGGLDINTDAGYQKYKGLKLSVQRRAATGMSMSGSYTLGSCFGLPNQARFNQTSAGYLLPEDPEFDAGPCIQDRRHIGTLTVGYLTPEVDSTAIRAVVSNWRVSGILLARTGDRINIIDLRDNAKTGIRNQRPNRVKDDIYGTKTLTNYFDRDAFSQAPLGANGNLEQNAAVGPNFWSVNLALSKLVSVAATQQLELRMEVFNLFNQFNWGSPAANFNQGTFGRITSMAGDPRIMQFGIKYGF